MWVSFWVLFEIRLFLLEAAGVALNRVLWYQTFSSRLQELREMVNLPGTRPDMVAADFEGVSEALKGQRQIKALYGIFFFILLGFLKKIIFRNMFSDSRFTDFAVLTT